MRIHKYAQDDFYEFELYYKRNSGSVILKDIAKQLDCKESELTGIVPRKNAQGDVTGICFHSPSGDYKYNYRTKQMEKLK